MTTKPTERDLIEEVEELLAKGVPLIVTESDFVTCRELLRRLVEEVRRLRQFGCEHCNCTCDNCGPCGEDYL